MLETVRIPHPRGSLAQGSGAVPWAAWALSWAAFFQGLQALNKTLMSIRKIKEKNHNRNKNKQNKLNGNTHTKTYVWVAAKAFQRGKFVVMNASVKKLQRPQLHILTLHLEGEGKKEYTNTKVSRSNEVEWK